jgi:hypothetical protein
VTATLLVLGVTGPLLAVTSAVSTLAGGDDSAFSGTAHGLAAAFLTVHVTVRAVLVGRFPEVCRDGCDPRVMAGGTGAALILLFALSAGTGLLITPLIGSVRALIRRLRARRRYWPAGVAVAGEPPRRRVPRALAVGLLAALLITFAVPAAVTWSGTLGLLEETAGGVIDPVRDAPPPGPPNSVAADAACAATVEAELSAAALITPASLAADTLRDLAAAQAAAASDDPGLRAIGRVVLASLKQGRPGASSRALDAHYRFCIVNHPAPR